MIQAENHSDGAAEPGPARFVRPQGSGVDPAEPRGLTWLTVVREGEQALLPALAKQLGWAGGTESPGDQSRDPNRRGMLPVPGVAGLEQEWILVDLSRAGDVAWPGARTLRPASRSPQQGLTEAAALARFEHLLLAPAWSVPAPRRADLCLQAWRSEPGLPLLFGGLGVTKGGLERLLQPHLWSANPPGGFEATLGLLRRELLALAPGHGQPWELELWQRLRSTARRLDAPLACISQATHERLSARLAADAELLVAWEQPPAERLEFSVLLATHQRVDVLMECLDGFARQALPRGSFEIVVVNDGSSDGTREALEALRLPVPFTQRSVPAGGAAKARRVGLPLCRGERILFINDDTIPFPDTLRAHLEAHLLYAPRPVSILGSFEQPPEHLRRLLMAYLENSTQIFGYPDFGPGEELEGRHYYTCNASTPRAAIEAIGGFDTSFYHYGCEDTDLGIRLEQAGVPLIFRPDVRARHQHLLSLADVRRRQPMVALAHVRLLRKHPWLLDAIEGWRDLTLEGLKTRLGRAAEARQRCEVVLQNLSDLDLEAIRAMAPEDDSLASELLSEFADVFPRISGLWWSEGFVKGFEQHGLSGFRELLENRQTEQSPCATA